MFVKDPTAVLDYTFDWTAPLLIPNTNGVSDAITASTWTVSGSGLTIPDSPAASFTGTLAVVWLAAGDDGERYELANHITTAGGRQDSRVVTIAIMVGAGSANRIYVVQ
ncbi:phage fiber-tail adaptor protein [Mycobacterium malmoense]|uniref:phage fiber-tail adaptor protein n=1 Tax=Mycobacterium malmoense TaxID=1780 RepID=UPI0008F92FE6|nr:hypothetical protein [Mycobacterium malmoense]OIN80859.1 hypothetical protein BMG05_11025 [Mycobacterium malmoense]